MNVPSCSIVATLTILCGITISLFGSPRLTMVERVLFEDGQWQTGDTMTLSYDTEGRLRLTKENHVFPDGNLVRTYSYAYDTSGDAIMEVHDIKGSLAGALPLHARTVTNYYFNDSTTFSIFPADDYQGPATFDHFSGNLFRPDIYRLDKTDIRAIDSVVAHTVDLDSTSQLWVTNFTTKMSFEYSDSCLTATTSEFETGERPFTRSVTKYFPSYDKNGNTESIYCDNTLSIENIAPYTINNTFDSAGRLVVIEKQSTGEDTIFRLRIEYNADGLPGVYLSSYFSEGDSASEKPFQKTILHYSDSSNIPVVCLSRASSNHAFSATAQRDGVIISVPQSTPVRSVTVLDLAGREIAEFKSFSSQQSTFRLPIRLNGAVRLLRIRTDRSAAVLRVNGVAVTLR